MSEFIPPVTALGTAAQADIGTSAGEVAAGNHGHDASAITSGVLDIARLPAVPSGDVVISSGAIADLTTDQQALILKGTTVTTTDGQRWIYVTGSKISEGSYIVLADTTPAWALITGKPVFGDAALLSVGSAAGTVAAGDHLHDARYVQLLHDIASYLNTISVKDDVPGAEKLLMWAEVGYGRRIGFYADASRAEAGVKADSTLALKAVGIGFNVNGADLSMGGSGHQINLDVPYGDGALSFGNDTNRRIGFCIGTSYPTSNLQSGGSVALGSDDVVMTAITLDSTRYAVYYNTSAAGITQPLPDATGIDGREYIFFKESVDANTLTLLPITGQGTSTTLSTQYACVTYRAKGGIWRRTAIVD